MSGWVFFAIVIALVMAAGWPLFDRRADEAFFDPAKLKGAVRHGGQAAVIAPLLIVIAAVAPLWTGAMAATRSEAPTSELQSLMSCSYAVLCLKHRNHTVETR